MIKYGLETEKTYPFTSAQSGKTGACKYNKNLVEYTLDSYYMVTENSPSAMATAL